VSSHSNKWTKPREHLQSEGISLSDFPDYRFAGLNFGQREVNEVFDQRDAPTDERAEAAVDHGRRIEGG
jgi:hypothetical protein